jgi:hypothetical protein
VFVTNVPGPQRPLYLLGARLLEVFPVVQVAGNVPLSVAVLSYPASSTSGSRAIPAAARPGRLRRRPTPITGGAGRSHTAPPPLSRECLGGPWHWTLHPETSRFIVGFSPGNSSALFASRC